MSDANPHDGCLDCHGSGRFGNMPCLAPRFVHLPVHEKEQHAVVAYIQNEEGKLLSVTRKDTGQHAAPGGKVEPGETIGEALQREVWEEAGIWIRHWEPVYEGLHSSGRRVHAFVVDEWHGEPVAKELGTRVAWVDPIEIANGFGADYHRKALKAAGIL